MKTKMSLIGLYVRDGFVKNKEFDGNHLVRGQYEGGFCVLKNSPFRRYCANESENQGGVDRCDQCGKVIAY